MRWTIATLALAALAAACGGETAPSSRNTQASASIERPPAHPSYRGKEMPEGIAAQDGRKIFEAQCVSCHGEKGDGDAPMGKALKPPSSDLTNPKLQAAIGDDYMFWRVSEGGAFPPFKSGMMPFKGTLSEEERWQVIAYIRTLQK